MQRWTGHKEEWGQFVDVKTNAIACLKREIRKKRVGKVWISGVCDPYQPIEKKYELTRSILEVLSKNSWPVTIQTKSPLVLRDTELLREFSGVEIGLTITTADESIRKIFEPCAPPIRERIEAVEKLHSLGIKTFVMIAPMLPKTEGLVEQLSGKADYVLIDRMNYHYADWVYRRNKLEYAMNDNFFTQKKMELANALKREEIPYQLLF